MKTPARATLDRDIGAINDGLMRMGDLVDAAIEQAVHALAQRDTLLAQQIVDGDARVNALRFEIEEQCLALIATQQPAAGDLRTVMAAFSIVTDLERMGDHAAGIARTVLRMGDEPLLKPLIDMPRMAEACREMLRKSLQAYISRDSQLARSIVNMDDTVDALYQQIFRELLSFMVEDPKTTTRALYLLFSAHNLERIGDRVTNIIERVIFLSSGEMKELNPKVSKAQLGDGPRH
jgi:phosphate transport system protein